MRYLKFVLCSVLSLLLLADVEVFAAQQKKAKVVVPPKPIYEASMRVVVVRNGSPACEPQCPEWISAEGEITAATPAAFRRVFKQIGSKNLPLIIRSPGGSINAALEIGNMVRKRKMTVAVGFTLYRGCRPDEVACKLPKEAKGVYAGSISEYNAFCNSACPMILAAGTTRLASSMAYVGLHQPKTEWSREWVRWRDTYRMVNGRKKILKRTIVSRKIVKGKTTYGLDKNLRKKMGNYYKSMGIDLAILDEMERAKYQDMYWLPEDGRDKLHLRTSVGSAAALGSVTVVKPGVSGIESCEIKGAKYVGEICKEVKGRLATAVVAKPEGSVPREKSLLNPLSPPRIITYPIETMISDFETLKFQNYRFTELKNRWDEEDWVGVRDFAVELESWLDRYPFRRSMLSGDGKMAMASLMHMRAVAYINMDEMGLAFQLLSSAKGVLSAQSSLSIEEIRVRLDLGLIYLSTSTPSTTVTSEIETKLLLQGSQHPLELALYHRYSALAQLYRDKKAAVAHLTTAKSFVPLVAKLNLVRAKQLELLLEQNATALQR
jgi:hypothetical protein